MRKVGGRKYGAVHMVSGLGSIRLGFIRNELGEIIGWRLGDKAIQSCNSKRQSKVPIGSRESVVLQTRASVAGTVSLRSAQGV